MQSVKVSCSCSRRAKHRQAHRKAPACSHAVVISVVPHLVVFIPLPAAVLGQGPDRGLGPAARVLAAAWPWRCSGAATNGPCCRRLQGSVRSVMMPPVLLGGQVMH